MTAILFAALGILGASSFAMDRKDEIPITTSSPEALAFYTQGLALTDNLRFQEAVPYFEKAVAKDSIFALARLNLAVARGSAGGSTEDFFKDLNQAVALVDKVSEGEKLQILALQALINANAAEAKALLLTMVATYPKDKRAHLDFGNYFFSTQEYSAAIDALKKAVEIDPNFAPPYNQLGYAYSALENFAEAEKALKKYSELIPDEPNPHDSLAEILMKEGKFAASIAAYRQALTLKPDFYSAIIGIGNNLILQEKHDQARKEFQKFYDLAPTNAHRSQALYSFAISYVDEEKLDNALKEIEKSYALNEKNKDLPSMSYNASTMGSILLESGKPNEALTKWTESVALMQKADLPQEQKEQSKYDAMLGEAGAALKKGDVRNAKVKAEQYRVWAEARNNPIDLQPYHAVAGMIALHEKHFDDAIKELRQANLRNAYNLFRLAKAYDGKGEKVKAKEFYSKAANYNSMSFSYAFIRHEAKKKLVEF